MKKIISGLILACVTLSVKAQTDENLGIIPAPVSVEKKSGVFNTTFNLDSKLHLLLTLFIELHFSSNLSEI